MLQSKKIVNSEYQFVRFLGEGLSSTVYEAFRSNSSGIATERVAVKLLKSKNSVSWLKNEFEALSSVSSPYCVRLLGHESFDEGAALILEFIEGVTLFELGSRFQLKSSEIQLIEAQVIQGLRAIHSRKLVHGDLNPKNILLSSDGFVKLIDFGSFEKSDGVMGAAPYISEKVWRGDAVNSESDFESWLIVKKDLRTQFRNVPQTNKQARARASQLKMTSNFETQVVDDKIQQSLAVKVAEILKMKSQLVSTARISIPLRSQFLLKKRTHLVLFALLQLLMLFPGQSILSEPLKTAETAVLLIRTHDWTEVKINGAAKGYAPLSLYGLAAGRYKIEYKRPHGSGTLELTLYPAQKRLIKDADFKD